MANVRAGRSTRLSWAERGRLSEQLPIPAATAARQMTPRALERSSAAQQGGQRSRVEYKNTAWFLPGLTIYVRLHRPANPHVRVRAAPSRVGMAVFADDPRSDTREQFGNHAALGVLVGKINNRAALP